MNSISARTIQSSTDQFSRNLMHYLLVDVSPNLRTRLARYVHDAEESSGASATDEQSYGDTQTVLLSPIAERDLVSRLDIPAGVLAWPKHEIQYGRTAPERGVTWPGRMHEFGARADHELELPRKTPWLLEEHVDRHFDTAISRDDRHPDFQFKPLLDRRYFKTKRASFVEHAFRPFPVHDGSEFQDKGMIPIVVGGRRRTLEGLRGRSGRKAQDPDRCNDERFLEQ